MQALVIDDQAVFRRAVSRMLGRMGFEVHQAEDGDLGLAQIAALPGLALVLMDWRMPGRTGLAVLEDIRREPRHRELRVVMVTALDDAIATAAALTAGANGFLIKPFAERDLMTRLEELALPITCRPQI